MLPDRLVLALFINPIGSPKIEPERRSLLVHQSQRRIRPLIMMRRRRRSFSVFQGGDCCCGGGRNRIGSGGRSSGCASVSVRVRVENKNLDGRKNLSELS